MTKTTIYLPPDLKAAVTRAAARRGTSEAEVIRESIRAAVPPEGPRPHGALFSSQESLAEQTEGLLAGFGDR